jgi:hypothetical protein
MKMQAQFATGVARSALQSLGPMDIVRDATLGVDEKRRVLQIWLRELQTTTPLQANHLQDVNLALGKLENGSGRSLWSLS